MTQSEDAIVDIDARKTFDYEDYGVRFYTWYCGTCTQHIRKVLSNLPSICLVDVIGRAIINTDEQDHIVNGDEVLISPQITIDLYDFYTEWATVVEEYFDGYVYVLKAGKHYKIGCTTELDNRIKSLTIQLPYAVKVVHTFRCT